MRIVKLKGGLGNQMFQYAFAKLLELKTNEIVKLDFQDYSFKRKDKVRKPRILEFNLSITQSTGKEVNSVIKFPIARSFNSYTYKASIVIEKYFNNAYFYEKNRSFKELSEILDYKYYDGYWQSYKYVDTVFSILKNEFVPKAKLSDCTLYFKDMLMNENSVFIGVRKGDYTKNKKMMNHYGSFDTKYYQSGMRIINELVSNPIFYVFSDDIEWCKKNINWGNYSVNFRDQKDQVSDFEELILMSSCKHAIIVNSTFNWWGAKLIANPEKIIVCPSKWFFDNKPIDIIPPEWIRLDIA